MTRKPYPRPNRADRLICPGASQAEIEADFATLPFDRAALDADRKWGVDRLPALVAPDMARRYGAALAYMLAQVEAGDAAAAAAAAANCCRALAAMDAAAAAAGHRPISPEAWPLAVGGKPCVLLRDAAAWPAYAAEHPGATFYTLQEVATALEYIHRGNHLVGEIKAQFPGSEIAAIRPGPEFANDDLDDELPW
jgi:hypothetical protein